MYRILRDHGESGERRWQTTHPAKTKPQLRATGPDQCWSWDITKQRGPDRRVYYDLYVIIDIYSRYVVADKTEYPRIHPGHKPALQAPIPTP